jgi:tetratricopeptide (TPR) repeat protein
MNIRPLDRIYQRAEEALGNRNLREAEKLAERVLQSADNEVRAHLLWARVLSAKGQLHRSIRYLRSIKGKSSPQLSQELGRLHHAAGQLEQARQAFLETVQECPDDADTWLRLADVCWQQGRHQQAAEACTQAIRQQPQEVTGYLRLGQLLQQCRSIDRAVAVYREGLSLLPDSAELLCDLGVALLASGRIDEAVESLGESLRAKPVNHAALFNLGSALMERGDFAAAEQRLEQVLRLRPALADAWYKLMHCRRQDESNAHHLSQMRSVLKQARLVESDRARLCFALGKALDDMADQQAAFEAFNEANALRAQSLNFNGNSLANQVDRVISVFKPELFEHSDHQSDGGAQLVFFVGLPRSGGALLNQVLCAHSGVTTIGAHDRAAQIRQRIQQMFSTSAPYPDAVEMLNTELVEDFSKQFTRGLRLTDRLITDLSAGNFLNLGLLKLLFPAARIVQLTRSPRDLCLSMYFNDLADVHDYAFDLNDLVATHHLYQRLMKHWTSLWPEQIHTLSYEQLVGDFDPAVSAALDFLGLEFETGCRNFHTRKNSVGAASSWRVRQPLYESSVGRWRHYQEQLGPLTDLQSAS